MGTVLQDVGQVYETNSVQVSNASLEAPSPSSIIGLRISASSAKSRCRRNTCRVRERPGRQGSLHSQRGRKSPERADEEGRLGVRDGSRTRGGALPLYRGQADLHDAITLCGNVLLPGRVSSLELDGFCIDG